MVMSSMLEIFSILIWWLAIEFIGLTSFPIASIFCKALNDKGYSVAKLFGLVITSYFCFVLSLDILNFGFWTIFLSIIIVIMISLCCTLYNLKNIISFFRDRNFIRTILILELVFFAFFVGFAVVRGYDPDINDGEKRMEFAFINAVVRAEHLPPPYPWMSGESLGVYYYFGHYLTAFMCIITGIPTAIGYNLALAMFFAFTAMLSFSLGFNMTRRVFYGLVFVFLVLFLANIFPLLQIISFYLPIPSNLGIDGYQQPQGGGVWDRLTSGSTMWWSTRIIPWSINEFPLFSFLWADLHHTLMAIPFRIMIIIICYSALCAGKNFFVLSKNNIISLSLFLIFFSLLLGFTIPLSTWDYPTMFLFSFIVVSLGIIRSERHKMRNLVKTMFIFLIILFLSLSLFFPVLQPLLSNTASGKINFETQRTSLYHFLILFSLFIFVILSYLIDLWTTNKEKYIFKQNIGFSEKAYLIFKFSVYTSLVFLLLNFQIVAILLLMIFFSFESLSKRISHNDAFCIALILMGVVIALLCELVNIGGRYISLFKFYLQLWVFWALASGYAIFYLRKRIKPIFDFSRWKTNLNDIIFSSLLIFLLISSSIYVVVAGYSEIVRSNQGKEYLPTLNGLAYLIPIHYPDLKASEWINKNIRGTPVILEIPGRSYTYSSRISWMTGLPTVLGWEHHVETHFSIPYEEIMRTRNADADTIYNTTDNVLALELIKKYNISYIYIGELEHDYKDIIVGADLEQKSYERGGLEKFSVYKDFYELVYNDLGVRIYKVRWA